MYDVVALGELLIDFTPAGVSSSGNRFFEQNPGGAPANVLAAVSKLGGNAAFIGKVGDDQFGHFLERVMKDNRIETKGLKFSNDANTTLAFVHLDEKGNRSFSFYRKPGADTMLDEKDLEFGIIDNSKIFHFGSLSMTQEPSKSATIKAVEYAKKSGKVISYDPNWRPALWKDEKSAKEGMLTGLKYTDILKISDEEHEFLVDDRDLMAGSKRLLQQGIKLIIVTMGAKGCFYRHKTGAGYMSTYDTRIIDTTGAGDAFLGGLLFKIGEHGFNIDNYRKKEIEEMLDFSNAMGALCASKRGAISGMPTLYEVQKCMESTHKIRV